MNKQCDHHNTTTLKIKDENFDTLIKKVKCDDCGKKGEYSFVLEPDGESWEDDE